MKGEQLEHIRFRHPLYDRDSLGVLADYVTLEQGTGAVHTAPGHGSDDFVTGIKYGLEVYVPVGPGGHFLANVPMFCGPARVRCECHDRGGAQGTRAPVAPAGIRALLSALLALPQPGDLPGHLAVVHRDGQGICHRRRVGPAPVRRSANPARRRDRDDRQGRYVGAGVGPRSHPQHDRQSPRLVHLAAAGVGRADSGGRLHRVRRSAADTCAGRARGGGVRHVWRRCLVRAPDRGIHPSRADLPGMRRLGVRARARHPRRVVRFRFQPRGRACRSGRS